MTDTNNSGGNLSVDDLSNLLRQSPFGALLNIAGVTIDRIIEGFSNAVGGNGDNPFGNGGLPSGGNIFADFGDPNAPGSLLTGNVNPWAALNQIGSDPLTGAGNPFAGGENPFAGGNNPFASGNNPFASGSNPFV